MRRCITWIGKTASWLSLVLVLVICSDVVARYCFNATQVWMIELEWHLFGVMFLLCGAWTWLNDRHVRVDVFYNYLTNDAKGIFNKVCHLILALPWLLVVIYATAKYAGYALHWNESSPDPGGLPARYVIKYCITFGFILMLFALLLQLFSNKTNHQS